MDPLVLDALTQDYERRFTKTSSVKALVGQAARIAKAHKPEIIAGLGMGALGAATGYLGSKRGKGGAPSILERGASSSSAENSRERATLARRGQEPSFTHKINGAALKGYKEFAKVLADHPARAALLFGVTLGTAGAKAVKTGRSWT